MLSDTIFVLKYQKHFACFAAALFSFFDLLQFSLFNVISKNLLLQFHLTNAQLGIFSSSYLIANAFGLIFIGSCLDHFSTRKTAITFAVLSTISCFVMASTKLLFIDILMRFIQGLASSVSLLVTTRMAVKYFPTKVALAIGIMMAIAQSGAIFGNIITLVVQYIKWQDILWMTGILGLFLIGFMGFFLFDYNKTHLQSINIRKLLQQIISELSDHRNILLGHYLGLMSFPIFVWGTLWGTLFLSKTYIISYGTAGFISSLLFVGIIIGSPLTGYAADKIGSNRIVMVLGALFSFLLIMFIMLGYQLDIKTLEVLFFFLGVFVSCQNVTYAVITNINIQKNISVAMGIVSLFANGIGVFEQIGFGLLMTFQGK